MNDMYRFIGAVVFWLTVFGLFDVIDFRLCVGPVGKCNPPAVTTTWKDAA